MLPDLPPKLRRYFRKTIAHPNGSIVHDGDCRFFDIKICTCGLLHELLPMHDYQEKYYEKFWEESGEHDNMIHKIMRARIKPDKPEPISEEDLNKIIKSVFGDKNDREENSSPESED